MLRFSKPFLMMDTAELSDAYMLQEQMVLSSDTPEQYQAAKAILQQIEEEQERRAQEWRDGTWFERNLERMRRSENTTPDTHAAAER